MTTTFEPRAYQETILQETLSHLEQQQNVLIELDCGMGKRYIMMKLVEALQEQGKILILLQTRSSLYETYQSFKDYFKNNSDLGLIHSQQNSKQREYIMKTKSIILSLPTTLRNALRKTHVPFDYIIINEVDTLVRRHGSHSLVLKQPYNTIFQVLQNAQVIGLSGTLKDNHYEITNEQILIRKDLEALHKYIPNSYLITMDSVLEDAQPYIKRTTVEPVPVPDTQVTMLYEIIEQTLQSIKEAFEEKHGEKRTPLFLRAQEIEDEEDEELLRKYSKALMLRKYLYAYTKDKIKQHFYIYYNDDKTTKQELYSIFKSFIGFTSKTKVLPSLLKNHKKIVVLMTYLAVVAEVEEYLALHDYKVFTLTGQTRDKAGVITRFQMSEEPAVLLLSNVGERDIDLVQADLLVLYDIVNTVKTVYQKLKRSRYGETKVLYYADTSEQKKLMQVLKKITNKYYWSTDVTLPLS